jgi:predicted ATP-grasp superfamily ATP-dependent carboligase
MVEYKRPANGRLALMEINGPPWGSLGLLLACGIDYGRYPIDWWLEGKLPPEKIR